MVMRYISPKTMYTLSMGSFYRRYTWVKKNIKQKKQKQNKKPYSWLLRPNYLKFQGTFHMVSQLKAT